MKLDGDRFGKVINATMEGKDPLILSKGEEEEGGKEREES